MVYLISFILPLLCLFAVKTDQVFWMIFPVLYTFVLIPSFDLFNIKTRASNFSPTILNFILYGVCAFYLGIFTYFLTQLPQMETLELVLKSFSMGISGGVIGINCGHELGHRQKKWEQLYAKLLLFTTSYTHFFDEHNKGHHKNVATPNDPATSRLNETLYAFFPRTIFFSWLSAFNIEKKKNSFFKNTIIHYAILQLLFVIGLFSMSTKIGIGFIIHSLVAILLLEAVNYIEHYGILRKKNASGRYEKVTPIHSWNSDHFFSRIHLFDLSRHSHHHANANVPYYELKSIEESPQMPYGYAGMILMAFVPPLWFKVMNPRITKEQRE